MDKQERERLENAAKEIRRLTIESIGRLGIGHIGGALSIVEILAALYNKVMKIDPANPALADRDWLVLSKGHAGPALYATLAARGYFPIDALWTLNQPETLLPSHCDMLRTRGIDMTAGSLGQGFSAAAGIALGHRLDTKDNWTYAIIGDGESQEGSIWETAMTAAHFKLDRLICFVDYNKMQIDGTVQEVLGIEPIEDKWRSFNWHVQRIDGHSVEAIVDAVESAKKEPGRPHMIICDTVKGKGAFFAEGKVGSHNMPITEQEYKQALQQLS